MAKSKKQCLTCEYYEVDDIWKTAGVCTWVEHKAPFWMKKVLANSDMRIFIVGQNDGVKCGTYKKSFKYIKRNFQ